MDGKIAVFCSASNEIDPEYNKVARDFVRAASLRGYAIVSGGTVKGTMGQIDTELSECGGYHIGIVPRFMKDIAAPGLSEIHWTDTMAERQAMMRKGALAAVALPGGIGTLDEVIETLTQKSSVSMTALYSYWTGTGSTGLWKPCLTIMWRHACWSRATGR